MHRRPERTALLTSALIAALAFSACDSGSKSPTGAAAKATRSTTTPSAQSVLTDSEKVPNIDMAMSSPVLKMKVIPARYTCAGTSVSPTVSWGNYPANTVEVDLFLVNLVHQTEFVQWAVAGLKPSLHKLVAGELPPGAVVGRNRFGEARYSLCPPKGLRAHYVILVFALPERLPVNSGFDSSTLIEQAVHVAEHEGQLTFSYKRA
jgi:phosphatidylethanolamine-binding protein (PEBP) family uncharacterized protein